MKKTVVCQMALGRTRVSCYTLYNPDSLAFEEFTPLEVKRLIRTEGVNGLVLTKAGEIELDEEGFNQRNLPVKSGVGKFRLLREGIDTAATPYYALTKVADTPDGLVYWELLNRAMEKYSQPSLLADTVTLKLSKRVASSAPTESRLAECLLALSPYRRTVHKRCESEMQEKYGEVIGYINYLSSCVERTPEENRLFNAVSDFLNGDTTALVRLKRRGR